MVSADGGRDAAGGRDLGRARARIGVLVGIPLSVLLVWLATRGIDADALRQAILDADLLPIGAAMVAIAVIYSIQAARWRWIAAEAGTLPWRTFLRMVIASVAVNNVVPGRPGEVARSYWLARALRIPQGRALSTVFVDRSCDVVVLAVALVAAYPFVPHPQWLRGIVLGGAVLGVVLLVLVVAARVWVALGGSPKRWQRFRASWAGRQISALTHGTAVAANRRTLATAYALTLASWTMWAVAAWLVARSVGVDLTTVEVVLVTAVINLGSAIPSSPGFIGTFQWLSVASLGAVGIGRTSAFAFSILMHAIWYVPTTVAGGFLAVRSGLSWRRAEAAEPRVRVPAQTYAAQDGG